MARLIQDSLLTAVTALAADGATVLTPAFDLGAVAPTTVGELCTLTLAVPAIAALADAKTAIYSVLDCATSGGVYVAVAGLDTVTSTGAGGVGCAAVAKTWRLPEGIRQFVKVQEVSLAAAGTITGTSMTVNLKF